jgi:hypothetical protein
MPRYGYGAVVLENQSPLGDLLGGLSQGINYKLQKNLRDEERTKLIKQAILEKAATGELQPSLLASREGQNFLASLGLDKDTHIMSLIEQGKATNAPLTTPVTNEMPTKDRGMGGPLVNIPRPEAPSAKQVSDIALIENTQRTMNAKQAESNIELMRQYSLYLMEDAQKRGQVMGLDELGKQMDDFKKKLRIQGKTKVVLDERGQPTITLEEPDEGTMRTNQRTAILNLRDYETPRTALFTHRQQAFKDLGAILRGEIESLNAFGVDSGMDPRALAIIQGVTAQKKKSPTMSPADSAELYIKAVNDAITEQNKSNFRLGVAAGVPAQQLALDQEAVKPITFKDVAGMSRSEWDRKSRGAALPRADEASRAAAEEARSSGAKGPDVTPRPSADKAKSDGDKIKGLYDEVSALVVQARSTNPGLSVDAVVANVRALKAEIMAQYGLNEKQYELFESMVKNAAKK